VESKDPLPRIAFVLTVDGQGFFNTPIVESGESVIPSVPPGDYMFNVMGVMPGNLYLKSARAGDVDVIASGLTITPGSQPDVQVTLGADGAALEGMVRDSKAAPVAGATVVMVADQVTRTDRTQTATSDQNGHYKIANIPPGRYRVYAWEDVEDHAWSDPEFLLPYREHSSAAELKPTSRTRLDLSLADPPRKQ
jgi:hypothetical protein